MDVSLVVGRKLLDWAVVHLVWLSLINLINLMCTLSLFMNVLIELEA